MESVDAILRSDASGGGDAGSAALVRTNTSSTVRLASPEAGGAGSFVLRAVEPPAWGEVFRASEFPLEFTVGGLTPCVIGRLDVGQQPDNSPGSLLFPTAVQDVSRRHALVEGRAGRFYVTPVSPCPTYANGKRLAKGVQMRVQPGALLTFGGATQQHGRIRYRVFKCTGCSSSEESETDYGATQRLTTSDSDEDDGAGDPLAAPVQRRQQVVATELAQREVELAEARLRLQRARMPPPAATGGSGGPVQGQREAQEQADGPPGRRKQRGRAPDAKARQRRNRRRRAREAKRGGQVAAGSSEATFQGRARNTANKLGRVQALLLAGRQRAEQQDTPALFMLLDFVFF